MADAGGYACGPPPSRGSFQPNNRGDRRYKKAYKKWLACTRRTDETFQSAKTDRWGATTDHLTDAGAIFFGGGQKGDPVQLSPFMLGSGALLLVLALRR